jgi:RHS repeat-associated protein
MPPPESTTPQTTEYTDDSAAAPRLTSNMSDDEIRDALRKAYNANADNFATEFLLDPQIQPKTLTSFKNLLKEHFDPKNDQFRPRFERLENEVVDEVAPKLLPNPDGSPPIGVSNKFDLPPTTPNVTQGADPVNLFNGNLVYSAADFQLNGAGMDFVFVRTYSQLAIYAGPMGQSWDHGYNLWLVVDDDGLGLHRSTGALGEETFRRHEQFDYWIPPDGVSGIILESGDSFVFRRPDGARILYQPHPTLHASVHVVARIEDRFGNHLNFSYEHGLLARVEVNHPGRVVDFTYDTEDRVVSIRDFTGRIWRYDYDTAGDLIAVTTPRTDQLKAGATVRYEYTGALEGDPRLQHLLKSITDADGRLYLENEYGTAAHLLSYRRVIQQRQGGGDVTFDYADVVEGFDVPYEEHERPTHQTIVTERDGRQARYLFNRRGNMIFKEEYARLGGLPKLIPCHYRYNRDGNLVGQISPLGAISQALYGRDFYERQFPRGEDYRAETDSNLTPAARLRFDNLLAVVKRGAYHELTSLNLARGLWSSSIFPDVLQTDERDAIQKFTYEDEFAQLVSTSDPRFTRSADPAFVEDGEYQRRLTKYSYAPGLGFEHLFLKSVELPTPTLPDGTQAGPVRTTFADYDDRGRVLTIVAPNGLRTQNVYANAAQGLRAGFLETTTLDPDGLAIARGTDRDQLGRVMTLRRPPSFDVLDGRYSSTNEYNELSQIVRSTGTAPFSVDTRHRYTRAGSVLRSETDLKDQTNTVIGVFATANRYDEELNLVRQTIGDDAITSIKQTKVVFDRASRPFLTIAPSGRKKKTSFNERSLVATVVQDYGGVHAVTRGFYDADGRLVRVVNPRGGATRFAYDALGRLIDTEDAKGNRIIRHFDKLGNLIVECLYERHDDDTFVLVYRREFAYDELGRLVIAGANKFTTQAPTPANVLLDAFRETGPGELLTIQDFYDGVGNLIKQIDQDGREFVSEYDIFGRITRKIDPIGNDVHLAYDKEGNVLRVDRREVIRDADNAVVGARHFAEAFVYDELNRLIQRRSPAGVLRYHYDSRGNQVRVDDPLDNTIQNTYDTFSRLVESRQSYHRHEPGEIPISVSTLFAYDLDDQKTTQTDALGRTTRFMYDSLGRLRATELPDGTVDSFSYDRFGNLIAYRDRNGLVRLLGWDELNRNTALTIDASGLPDGASFPGAIRYRSEYDALGRFTRVEDDFVVNRFGYNSLGHLLTETTSFTEATGLDPTEVHEVRRAFANTGAVTGLTYPSGREIRYSRDILDRIVAVEQVRKGEGHPGDSAMPDSFTIATVDYAGMQPIRLSRANGISTEFQYDFSGRTVGISHSSGAQNILTLQCLYDRLGNMRERIEVSEDHQGVERFRYDSVSQVFEVRKSDGASLHDLSSVAPAPEPLPDPIPDRQPEIDLLLGLATGGETAVYEYDVIGNRTLRSVDGVSEPYITNALDQYTTIDSAPRLYDANGNLIEDDRFAYGYDHRNQLTSVTRKADDQETRFFLDYFGRRTLQRAGPSATVDLYDGHNLIEEYDGDQLIRTIVSNTTQDGLLLASAAGADQFFLSDLTGSVRYLFDGPAKRAFYLFDEFGNLRSTPAPIDDNPFRFAGKRILAGTGMYDFVYRAYDPRAGRFLQRDPIGYVDGLNLYAFVRNNPLVFTDPLGLESRREHLPIAAKLGAELAYRNPKGFTLALPNNFDNDKMRTYKERINNPTDRGVGIRSRPPGAKTATTDIRRANRGLRDAYEAGLPGAHRPAGTHIDHTVELQHIIRGNAAPGADLVRPQDHRVQNAGLNMSQGSQAKNVKLRQVQNGAPVDTSAGGAARERDLNKFWNREGYRTGMRYFGYYNMIGGTFSSLSSVGDDIREGNFGSAALNTSAYLGGAFELGGLAANSMTLLNAGRFLGAPAAVVAAGVIGVRIGTNLYENYVDKQMYLDVGSWVEDKTGSRILGAAAASVTAIGDAVAHAPEAAIDYASEMWTLDSDEVDWDRTLKPWKWL